MTASTSGKPIRLFVTVCKSGDRIAFDWTGSSPQVKGAINATLSVTAATSFTAIRSILPPDIPNNDGTFRAVEVTAPTGTIANMVLPGACAARGLTGFRMLDCAFGALAKMAPDKVCAASDGGNIGVSVGGYRADRSPFIYIDFTCGTWGRAAVRGRARGQCEPAGQHGRTVGRSLRDREPGRDPRQRAGDRRLRSRTVPGRCALLSRLPAERGGGDRPGPLGPPDPPARTGSTAASPARRAPSCSTRGKKRRR